MPRQWAWIPAAAQLPVGLPRSVFKGGAETDADRTRGRWHCNVVCEVDVKPVEGRAKIGVDLGLKSVAKCNNGLDLEQATFYRNLEPKLAEARRRGRKRQVGRSTPKSRTAERTPCTSSHGGALRRDRRVWHRR
jgi:putative transposase